MPAYFPLYRPYRQMSMQSSARSQIPYMPYRMNYAPMAQRQPIVARAPIPPSLRQYYNSPQQTSATPYRPYLQPTTPQPFQPIGNQAMPIQPRQPTMSGGDSGYWKLLSPDPNVNLYGQDTNTGGFWISTDGRLVRSRAGVQRNEIEGLTGWK